MLFSARITELERQVLELSTERDTLAAANKELGATNERLTAEATAHGETIGTLTRERDEARTALQTEKDGREAAIAAEVTKRFTAAGGEPIKRDPAAVPREQDAAKAGAGRTAQTWARDFSK
jgi:peptidoglycan hydrolase CwlO-like protein